MSYSQKLPAAQTVQIVSQSSLSKITSIRVSDVLTGLRSSNFQNQTNSTGIQVFNNLYATVLSSVVSNSPVLVHHLSSLAQFVCKVVLLWQSQKVTFYYIVFIVIFR